MPDFSKTLFFYNKVWLKRRNFMPDFLPDLISLLQSLAKKPRLYARLFPRLYFFIIKSGKSAETLYQTFD